MMPRLVSHPPNNTLDYPHRPRRAEKGKGVSMSITELWKELQGHLRLEFDSEIEEKAGAEPDAVVKFSVSNTADPPQRERHHARLDQFEKSHWVFCPRDDISSSPCEPHWPLL